MIMKRAIWNHKQYYYYQL